MGADRLAWEAPAGRPLVVAHRGASAERPENTMSAFELAFAQGADGFELDVLPCRSGEVLVFHDDDLERLTGHPGQVRRLDWDTMRRLRVQGEPIPLLPEVLSRFLGRTRINIELKSAPSGLERILEDGLAGAVAALLPADAPGVLVSSFDPILLRRFARRRRDIPTGLLFASDQSLALRNAWSARLLRPFAMHPESALVDAAAMHKWRRAGYRVHTWTVDAPAELRTMGALGVDAVITNQPAATLAVFAS